MDERLKKAYFVAARARHEARMHALKPVDVQIHVGSNGLEHLRSLCTIPSEPGRFGGMSINHIGGFPLIEADERLGPDHVSVHAVHLVVV